MAFVLAETSGFLSERNRNVKINKTKFIYLICYSVARGIAHFHDARLNLYKKPEAWFKCNQTFFLRSPKKFIVKNEIFCCFVFHLCIDCLYRCPRWARRIWNNSNREVKLPMWSKSTTGNSILLGYLRRRTSSINWNCWLFDLENGKINLFLKIYLKLFEFLLNIFHTLFSNTAYSE